MNGGETEYNAILKTFYSTEDNAEKRFAFSLGASLSPALKQRTMDWAIKRLVHNLYIYFNIFEIQLFS